MISRALTGSFRVTTGGVVSDGLKDGAIESRRIEREPVVQIADGVAIGVGAEWISPVQLFDPVRHAVLIDIGILAVDAAAVVEAIHDAVPVGVAIERIGAEQTHE